MAVLSVTTTALAQTLLPGNYETHKGWGSLGIQVDKDEVLLFTIDTTGANGHTCSLDGKIKGNTGYTETNAEQPQCLILFEVVEPNGLSISTLTNEACRNFCGSRAGFEGKYFLPPPGCNPTEREARRNSFLALYRSHKYSRAYDTLSPLYKQCHDFLTWVEIDAMRNDLAITQFHLGHKKACLSILNDTIGATKANEDELRSNMAPLDFDNYLPVAQATWYNLKQCNKAAEKR